MNGLVETLNLWFGKALPFVWPMLWQSSLLIAVVFALDQVLRRKLRAAVRYGLWLVVLVKIVLPPSFAFPSGAAWWLRGHPATAEPRPRTASLVVSYASAIAPSPNLEFPARAVDFRITKPHLSTGGWMLATSASVSLALFGWMLLRWVRVAQRARHAASAPASLTELLTETKQQARLALGVRIKLTEASLSPAVCGLFFPVILFPRALAERLAPTQLRAVLLHELFHVTRGDVWVNLLQTLLQLLYWWHPLLWLANSRIRRLREEAVDDCVMLALRDEADTYAPTLLEVAKMTLRRPLASLGLVGIVESKSSLRRRIERLLNFRKPNRAGLTFQSLAALIAFSALAVPMGQAPERLHQALSEAQPQADPSPASRLPGYLEVNLGAQFFSAESSTVQAVFPWLLQNNRLLVIVANDLAAFKADLQRANVRPIAEGEPFHVQVFSGGRYHYRVGGVTSNYVNYEIKQGSDGGAAIGAQIELVSSLPEWVPIEFTLSPLNDTDSIRCQMELTSAEQPGVRERAEASIPPGGAVLWATSEEFAPGNCQLVFLTRNATETGADQSTGPGPFPSKQAAASDLAPLRDWLESHRANQGTVARTNPTAPGHGADSPVAVQEHSDSNRTPGGLGDRLSILQQFKNAGYNLPETIVDEVVREHATGRQATLAALDRIRLDQVKYDGLALREVIKDLNDEAKKRDPEKRGINFIINPNVDAGGATAVQAFDPITGLLLAAAAPSEPVDVGATLIKLSLTDVRLADLLAGIVKGADKPIKYLVEEYAVVFSSVAPTGTPPLFVRTFRIDLETLRRGLRDVLISNWPAWSQELSGYGTAEPQSTNEADARLGRELFDFFLSLNVDLRMPGKSIFYGDLEGTLLVRGTLQDLAIIEETLQLFRAGKSQPEVDSYAKPGPAVAIREPMLTQTNGSPDAGRANASLRPNQPELFTRIFQLDPWAVKNGLNEIAAQKGIDGARGSTRPSAEAMETTLRVFLTKAGADLSPPRAIFWNDQEGTLLIRASLHDLDLIEQAFHALNASPRQVNVKMKFVEIDGVAARGLLDGLPALSGLRLVTNSTSPSIAEGTFPPHHWDIFGVRPPMNSVVLSVMGVLSDPQYRVLLHALEQREGVDLLSEQSVTTLSGRQTQIQTVDAVSVVRAPAWTPQTPSTSTNLYQTERVLVGPVVDVTPYVARDGFSIKLSVVGTVTEFLGYDNLGQLPSGALAQFPLPHFRVRQHITSEQLFDGQTLMLVGLVKEDDIKEPKGKPPVLGGPPNRMVQSEASLKSKKHLLIFITPTLIDPAGNRVHSDSEIEQRLPKPK